jgi:serine protease
MRWLHSDIVDAIRWAAGIPVPNVPANAFPARVMNLSFGGYTCDENGQNCDPCDAPSQSAINDAVAAGSVVVVSAGNDGEDASHASPANCSGVITVAATGRQGERASYSNFGSLVEISAPGGRERPIRAVDVELRHDHRQSKRVHLRPLSGHQHGGAARRRHRLAHAVEKPRTDPCAVSSKIQTTARAFPAGSDCTTAICGAGIIDALCRSRVGGRIATCHHDDDADELG